MSELLVTMLNLKGSREQIFNKEAFCKAYLRISVQSPPPAQWAVLEIEMLPRSCRGLLSVARSENAHMSHFLKKALGGNPNLTSFLLFAGTLRVRLLKSLTET